MTSERTKAALAAAKARGTVLGAHGSVLAALHKAEALASLESVADVLRALRAEGLSIRQIVAVLNERGVVSPGGGRWHPSSVQGAVQRLEIP